MSERLGAALISMLRANSSSLVVALVATTNYFGSATAQPGMTYESLKELPDFAGSWTPLMPPFVLAPPRLESERAPPPGPCLAPDLKPEVAARCRETIQQRAGVGPAPSCARQYFVGRPPQGAGGAFEILFTPGRVTMAVEAGYVRRIYLRDEQPAGALDVSRSGNSIGRWEGSTLVIETTGLDPTAPFVQGSTLGPDAHVVERIALVDTDTLSIEATLTAPSVLAAPRTVRQRYRRAPDRVFTDFETCVDGDRSFDRTTGRDRFDKTPPSDLPPPPAE
jgi:hypothetical protein